MERYEEYIGAVAQIGHDPNHERYSKKVFDMIREAKRNGAQLVVFPECATPSGSIFHDLDVAKREIEPIPGPFINKLLELTKELGLWVSMGAAEAKGGKYYNSTVICGPDGKIVGHPYRKNFPVNFDWRWCSCLEPGEYTGEVNYPVFDTPLGRLGMFICGDAWCPENARSLGLRGVEVFCYSALWGGLAAAAQWNYNVPSRCTENRVWILAADKVGGEHGMMFPGNSFIMDPDGNMLAKADVDETILYARIRPSLSRNKKLRDGTDLYATRRPDKYGLVTTPLEKLPVYAQQKTAIVPEETTTHLGCVELDGGLQDSKEKLVGKALEIATDATMIFCSVIVLPELYDTSVHFDPKDWAEPIPGPTSDKFAKLAKDESSHVPGGVFIAYGAVESEGKALYKTTVLIGNGEILGKYRAIQLSKEEATWAKAGDDYMVCDTPIGKIGLIGGMDIWYPEITRSLGLLGADCILYPRDYRFPQERNYFAKQRAVENKVFMAVASKRIKGKEGTGGSMIVSPWGNVIVEGKGVNQLIKFQIRLVCARTKIVLPGTDLILNRRPHIYGEITKPVKSTEEIFRAAAS